MAAKFTHHFASLRSRIYVSKAVRHFLLVLGILVILSTGYFGLRAHLTHQAKVKHASQVLHDATELFQNGKNAEAAEILGSLPKEGTLSTEIYYNLAESQFRAGQIGKSYVNFARAAILSPSDKNTQQKLARLEQQLRLAPTETQWIGASPVIFGNLRLSTLAFCIAVLGGWTMLIGFIILLFPFELRFSRQNGLFTVATGFVLTLITLLIAIQLGFRYQENRSRAVVIAPTAVLRSAPADNESVIARLGTGRAVEIGVQRGPWSYAMASQGLQGWIATDQVEMVVPESQKESSL